ncbi:sortase [Candidatus Roizmanbacteria bacterium]|nr:sortase [Candidatus Roizmanbacteria bacterium]
MKNATKLSHKHIIRHHIHRVTSSEYFRVLVLRTLGNFLLFSSLFLIGKTLYSPVREEIKYFINAKLQKKYVVAEKIDSIELPEPGNKGLLAKAFNFKPIEVLAPQDPQFSIVIPKIGANAKIFGNTNAADEKEYLNVLEKGVAHAAGTAYPGEGGHIFLFAHSTDYFWNVGNYNAVFYLLYKLEKNDEVDLFYDGQRHVYRVIGTEIVDPSQVQYLTRKTNREFLTLQTCWPPGTTLKRLLVFAVRVAE